MIQKVLSTLVLIPILGFSFDSIEDQASAYKARYGSFCNEKAIVNYRGKGTNSSVGDKLEGTKNVKMLMPGVVYWGGSFHSKALPSTGRNSLCLQGFSKAYSLYNNAPNTTVRSNGNTMEYVDSGDFRKHENLEKIASSVFETIQADGDLGPVYIHCHNGKHASLFVAAIMLKQFCGVGSEGAKKYFHKMIHSLDLYKNKIDLPGGSFRKWDEKIEEYQVNPRYVITPSQREAVCF